MVDLKDSDFKQGKLSVDSYIKPNRIFTADKLIVLYKIGSVKEKKMDEVTESVITILRE